jgi:hypothetical protein
MAKNEANWPLPRAERQAIFLALVQAQDAGASVAQSLKEVSQRFGITEQQLKRIEQEGIDGQWPPLG